MQKLYYYYLKKEKVTSSVLSMTKVKLIGEQRYIFFSEFRSSVKVEVAVLGSPSIHGFCGIKATLTQWLKVMSKCLCHVKYQCCSSWRPSWREETPPGLLRTTGVSEAQERPVSPEGRLSVLHRRLLLLNHSVVLIVIDCGLGLTTMAQTNLLKPDRVQNEVIIIINFIYNAPVPVLQKRAPSTVQLHISGSIHS